MYFEYFEYFAILFSIYRAIKEVLHILDHKVGHVISNLLCLSYNGSATKYNGCCLCYDYMQVPPIIPWKISGA